MAGLTCFYCYLESEKKCSPPNVTMVHEGEHVGALQARASHAPLSCAYIHLSV